MRVLIFPHFGQHHVFLNCSLFIHLTGENDRIVLICILYIMREVTNVRPIYISVLVIYLFVPFIHFYSFFIFVETLYILWIIDLLYSKFQVSLPICHLSFDFAYRPFVFDSLVCFVCHTEVLIMRLNLSVF